MAARFAPRAELTCPVFWALLQPALEGAGRVLEIGSGTGQHVGYFAARAPAIRWLPTEIAPVWLDSIAAWASLDNVEPPARLEVGRDSWPAGPFEAVIALNLLHLLDNSRLEALFAGARAALEPGRQLVASGAFAVEGIAPPPAPLPGWGPPIFLRPIEALEAMASAAGFELVDTAPIDELGQGHRLLRWRSIIGKI